MDFISKEHDTDYKYCPEKRAYLSFNAKGEQLGAFPEQYVVDPVVIWKNKAKLARYVNENGDVDFRDTRVLSLKPTQTVFKIWEHRNANLNK